LILSLKDERQRFVMVEKTNIPGHHLLVRYLHDSHQGSCTLETDESGNVITYEEYHPFGTSSYQATNAGILSSSKRYRFCAKERDSESGLYYYGARYYVPWLCRFISCDPKAAETPQQSPYNYCNNNPINLIDPDGQQAVEPDDPPQGDGGDKIYNGGVFPEVVITGVKELTEADIENMGAGTEFSLFKAVTDYENYSKEEDFSNLGTYSKNLTQSNEPYHPNPNYHGDRKTYYNDLFVANENYNFSNFASVTMGNLISVFGKDHSINQFMSQIDIVRDAVAQWKTENSELSFEQQQPLNEFFHYEPSNAVMDLIDSFFTGREFTTPEQVIGSANVQITPIKEGVLEISVFNVTSIGSGNIENGRSYMRQPNFEGKQSYRNIIQTFNFNYYLR
jgi:RHS repeat-associated protein